MNIPDQLPPHDSAAESGALACVLSDPAGAEARLDALSEDLFADIRHVAIFRALLSLQLDGIEICPVSLCQRLSDNSETESAGGMQYVAGLPDATPSAENFPFFLDRLKDRALRRALLRDTAEIGDLASDAKTTPAQLLEAVKRFAESHRTIDREPIRLLDARAFNAQSEPPQLRTVYSLAGTPIATPGNVVTITAAVKSGKTAVLGAMVASTMALDGADCLGFASSNPDGNALLLFDSEQSPVDFWHCMARAIKRAGLVKPPSWLLAYCLTGLGHRQAWDCVTAAINQAADQFPGFHSILLDGAADFVADVNDAGESNDFVATLHGLAIERDCPVVGVIHFNPGSDKSRGHLGSQLERKAETNLALEKDLDESTVIYSTKNRRAGIPKATGPRFKFDPDAGMHVSVESRASAKDAEQRDTLQALADDLFLDRRAMRYSDLQLTVKKNLTVSPKTAQRKVDAMIRLGVIRKSVAGLYTINTIATT